MNDRFKELSTQCMKELTEVFERMDDSNVRELLEEIKKTPRIFLLAAGREGLATKSFAMRLMHLGKESFWIWDDTTPHIGKGDLLIATLGDGSIGHIDYVCRRAKEAGAYICVVTGSPSGKTAKEVADQVFFIPACVYRGTDPVVPSFQPMGNLFEQCLLMVFDVIVMTLVDEIPDLTFEKMSMRHRNVE